MLQKYANPLKIASLIVAAAGYFIANELQRRETEEYIEKAVAKHEAKRQATCEAS